MHGAEGPTKQHYQKDRPPKTTMDDLIDNDSSYRLMQDYRQERGNRKHTTGSLEEPMEKFVLKIPN